MDRTAERIAGAKRAPGLLTLLLTGVWAILYLPALITRGLHYEEGRRALAAMDMLEHGRWLLPQVLGLDYLSKPPLLPWAIAAVGWLQGRRRRRRRPVPAACRNPGQRHCRRHPAATRRPRPGGTDRRAGGAADAHDPGEGGRRRDRHHGDRRCLHRLRGVVVRPPGRAGRRRPLARLRRAAGPGGTDQGADPRGLLRRRRPGPHGRNPAAGRSARAGRHDAHRPAARRRLGAPGPPAGHGNRLAGGDALVDPCARCRRLPGGAHRVFRRVDRRLGAVGPAGGPRGRPGLAPPPGHRPDVGDHPGRLCPGLPASPCRCRRWRFHAI